MWLKDNKKFFSGDRYIVYVDGLLFLIIWIRIEDFVWYMCIVESVVGIESVLSKV